MRNYISFYVLAIVLLLLLASIQAKKSKPIPRSYIGLFLTASAGRKAVKILGMDWLTQLAVGCTRGLRLGMSWRLTWKWWSKLASVGSKPRSCFPKKREVGTFILQGGMNNNFFRKNRVKPTQHTKINVHRGRASDISRCEMSLAL